MRAHIRFVIEKFEEFNALCFDGSLPPIELKIGTARRALGSFRYPVHFSPLKQRGMGECSITISNRFDMPVHVIEDTIIHEMIHYWVWLRRLDNEPSHGPSFRKKMNEINRLHNRKITIRHQSEDEISDSDIAIRDHYICVTHWKDCTLGITIVARTRIFELHRAWQADARIEKIEWYWSRDPWFNRFPTTRTPKAWKLTRDDYECHVAEAMECEIDGSIFRPVVRRK
ncbi:MAG: SprT-like domain-containing protein [Muribaculaceae bacterium]|nr:SprT-like domain-containing protein [Muribaculaceae bacterium]